MKNTEGKPVVPLNCSQRQTPEWFDINSDDFTLSIKDKVHTIDVDGMFYDGSSPSDEPAAITIAHTEVPGLSKEAMTTRRIDADSEGERRMGEIFTQRIIDCDVKEIGVCWALGYAGVIAAIREYDQRFQ
jgi:hypothetical protein